MIELLSTYSSGEIIVFVFMLLIALKEVLELFKYFNNIDDAIKQRSIYEQEFFKEFAYKENELEKVV